MFVICWRLQRVEPKVSHMPCSENWTTGAHVQEFLLGAMTVINFQGLLLQITTSWMTQNNRSLSPLVVLEARDLKFRCWQGRTPSERCVERLVGGFPSILLS